MSAAALGPAADDPALSVQRQPVTESHRLFPVANQFGVCQVGLAMRIGAVVAVGHRRLHVLVLVRRVGAGVPDRIDLVGVGGVVPRHLALGAVDADRVACLADVVGQRQVERPHVRTAVPSRG